MYFCNLVLFIISQLTGSGYYISFVDKDELFLSRFLKLGASIICFILIFYLGRRSIYLIGSLLQLLLNISVLIFFQNIKIASIFILLYLTVESGGQIPITF